MTDDIEVLLGEIRRRGPAAMPDHDYKILEGEAGRWGRRRLREAFLREARVRYGAEAALREFGFVQDRHGRWGPG